MQNRLQNQHPQSGLSTWSGWRESNPRHQLGRQLTKDHHLRPGLPAFRPAPKICFAVESSWTNSRFLTSYFPAKGIARPHQNAN
jgi:hypothetical protein